MRTMLGVESRFALIIAALTSASSFLIPPCPGSQLGLRRHVFIGRSFSPVAMPSKHLARASRSSSGLRMDQNFGGFNPHYSPPASDASWRVLSQVYVLLFSPRTDEEGIYTLQQTDDEGRQHHRVVLFESKEDAERFGGLLEAQDFPRPHVESLEPEVVDEFVSDSGYETAYIPAGAFFLPPESKLNGFNAPGGWGESQQGELMSGHERDKANDGHNYNLERIRMEAIFRLFEATSPHETLIQDSEDLDGDVRGTH